MCRGLHGLRAVSSVALDVRPGEATLNPDKQTRMRPLGPKGLEGREQKSKRPNISTNHENYPQRINEELRGRFYSLLFS